MLHLRRQKAEILEDCQALQAKVRQFSDGLQAQLGSAMSAEPSFGSNEYWLQSFSRRGVDHPLNQTLREARRVHTRLRHEFAILIDVSLASDSADEYRRAHRPVLFAIGGTPVANYDILLRELDNTYDQIEYFRMEVEASEELVAESEAIAIDVGIVVALGEEFGVLRKALPPTKTVRENNRYYYECEIPGPGQAPRKGIATMIGEMGPTRAAVVTSELLRFYRPKVVVMLGIAGSVTSDLLLGDVVVARGIDDYAASAKTVDVEGGFQIQTGGLIFTPTKSIVELAKNFPFAHETAYKEWQQTAAAELAVANGATLGRKVGQVPKVAVEVVASGAYVSASASFNRFLREHRNREIKCIEMESSGLMNSIHQFAALKSMVVRGISDHADDEKASLEAGSAEFFRRYAMQNAVTFFQEISRVPDFWAD